MALFVNVAPYARAEAPRKRIYPKAPALDDEGVPPRAPVQP